MNVTSRKISWISCSLLLLVLCAQVAAQPAPGEPIPGKFLVKLAPGVRTAAVQTALSPGERFNRVSALQTNAAVAGADEWNRWHTFSSTDTTLTQADVVNRIGARNIEHIEPDYMLVFFDMPTDALFDHQWYLHNTGQPYYGIQVSQGTFNDSLVLKQGVPGVDVNVEPLYTSPPPETTRVVVAIVDTGVDIFHPELRDRLWRNPDEIPNNDRDDDHNGFVDDTLGYDVSGDSLSLFDPEGDNHPVDENGHGTHIAGIVASRGDQDGVIGVAPFAEIMPVKIRPNGTNAIGAAGIVYAVNAGAQVINISWGTPFQSFILKDALDIARRNEVFVSIAAGNSGDNTRFFPAAFDSAFAVAAGNSEGLMTNFSTFGEPIDLVAPGRDILSLRADGTDLYAEAGEPLVRIIDSLYYISDGTSMATPVVVGAAANLLAFRPDLSVSQIEDLLRMSADDMLDPRNVGDSLPGPDTVSGWGYINLNAALSMLTEGGIHVTQPIAANRYQDSLTIKIAPVAGYTGGWTVEMANDPEAAVWDVVANGQSVPVDSIAAHIDGTTPSGRYYLRLTDDFGASKLVPFTFVSGSALEITSPTPGEEYEFSIPIYGRAFGRDYDSLQLSFRDEASNEALLLSATGEYFDSLIFTWNASGLDTGQYTVVLEGFYQSGPMTSEIPVTIRSAFADGWPNPLSGRASYSPVSADLDNDGTKEIIVGTTFGLNVFNHDGTVRAGFPVLPDHDCRCIPAVYDIDKDSEPEIVITSDHGLFAFNHDGTLAPEFFPVLLNPNSHDEALEPLGYGFPQPTITQLGNDPLLDSAIVFVTHDGLVRAYTLDGLPYFRSLDGYYTLFNEGRRTQAFFFGGNAVSATDVNGDNLQDVVVTYSAATPTSGVGIFDGRTGEPAFDRPEPFVISAGAMYGTVLGDLNDDDLPEIVTVGYDNTGTRTIWAKTMGTQDLPGFPVHLPELDGYRGTYPTLADLDLDGTPEIIASFFEFDVGSIYVFRADGTPYITREGLNPGEFYRQARTLGTPIVANLTGDEHPEIVVRSGYILPGTGAEQVHILDHTGEPVPGWPSNTPAAPREVFSTIFAPLADDLDGDGLMELALVGDANVMYVWNFEAAQNPDALPGRLFIDNLNSSIYPGSDVITDVEDDQGGILPATFSLRQNYPNPFNPTTRIEFSLPQQTEVSLDVFNILGRKVETLIDGELSAGEYSIDFHGSRYASGTYFYRLRTETFEETRKMVLLK